MRKLILIIFMLTVQFNFGQEDYSEYSPIEPLYDNGARSNFFDYLSKTIDLSKVQNEKNVVIAFVLDSKGKMNHIKVAFCENKEAENNIISALQNAKIWDLSNQKDKNLFICYKIKLFFSENKTNGLTKIVWLKNDIDDVKIDPNDFTGNRSSEKDENQVYYISDFQIKPEYPGGMSMFYKFIGDNFQVPSDKNFIPGRILVVFVIEKDGTLSDIKVHRNLGFDTDKEVIRVLNLSEKWLPAEENGKKVRCSYTLPIEITIPR